MATLRIVVEDATGQLLATADPVTFGTRTGCSVVLDDAIAAARHCEFAADGRFTVRDLGSVTGTWLDGNRVTAATEVRDGNQIVFGASRALAKVEDRDGATTLVLQLQRNGFWWRKPGKKVFDSDPDALVRAEVGFGRFPALHASNRAAMVGAAVLLLAAAFVAGVMKVLADPGPLIPTHALVTSDVAVDTAHATFATCRALADAQGCNVCHATGAGAPERKCVQCHGDFAAAATRRHPYVGDGVLGDKTGMAPQQFCVLCHTDHVGKGEWLKPISATLVGQCEKCHGAGNKRDNLVQSVPPKPAEPRDRTFATYTFPHAGHAELDCRICHTIDPEVRAKKDGGFPDDPAREDFATVPYETCAFCHVEGWRGTAPAALAALDATAQQKAKAQKPEHRWTVAWHGTDDSGKHCAACHASSTRGGATVFGPELQMIPRPLATPAEYAAERAHYTTPIRRHTQQFADHAKGQDCKQCHLADGIAPGSEVPRSFWHALHLADGALAATGADRARISNDATAGCASCHRDVLGAKTLTDATTAAYHWPATAAEQAACTTTCHRENDQPLPLRATATAIAAARRAPSANFPHDLHVASKSPVLADGCFACHTFEATPGGRAFELTPRTLAAAKDCTQCHAGHDHTGGGQCKACHPAEAGRSNSFLVSANVAAGTLVRGKPAPAEPTRKWPALNPFSHLSIGHREPVAKDCTICHDAATVKSKAIADVPIPDDATPACRKCHLERQFHWR